MENFDRFIKFDINIFALSYCMAMEIVAMMHAESVAMAWQLCLRIRQPAPQQLYLIVLYNLMLHDTCHSPVELHKNDDGITSHLFILSTRE